MKRIAGKPVNFPGTMSFFEEVLKCEFQLDILNLIDFGFNNNMKKIKS